MLRYKEYVYAVYKAGSFSAAAEALFLSQPCLSAMVKKAEEQLGVPVFDRKTKPITLTEYGEKYIAFLEKNQELELEFEQYLNDVRGLRTGKLFVGANNVFASYVLPELIHQFKKLYPGVNIQMTEGNIAYLEDALSGGSVDLILDNCPLRSDLYQQHALGTERLLLTVHKTFRQEDRLKHLRMTYQDVLDKRHLLPDAPIVSVRDFANIPFIALREGNDTRYRMNRLFADAEKAPEIQQEVDQLATAYNIACNKLGATLVSDTLIYKGSPNPDMDFYLLDRKIANRPIYLYHKRSRYVTLAMQKFLEIANAFFQNEALVTVG